MPALKKTDRPAAFNDLTKASAEVKETNDCAVKAVAIVTRLPYTEVHAAFAKHGRKTRQGTPTSVTQKVLEEFGFSTKAYKFRKHIDRYPGVHSTLKNVTTHHFCRFPNAWEGFPCLALLVTSDHIMAAVNSETVDWSVNSSLRVQRCLEVIPPEGFEYPEPAPKAEEEQAPEIDLEVKEIIDGLRAIEVEDQAAWVASKSDAELVEFIGAGRSLKAVKNKVRASAKEA